MTGRHDRPRMLPTLLLEVILVRTDKRTPEFAVCDDAAVSLLLPLPVSNLSLSLENDIRNVCGDGEDVP